MTLAVSLTEKQPDRNLASLLRRLAERGDLDEVGVHAPGGGPREPLLSDTYATRPAKSHRAD
jgi:hypothetical protein